MSLFRSATISREDEASAVRDGNSAVSRLIRFTARILLWGCVLLLIIRGIASEFSAPQTVTTTRGVTRTVSAPAPAHVSTTGGSTGAVNQPTYPPQSPEGK
jgi:hypothetical protein